MQIKNLRIKSYRSWRVDETPEVKIAIEREKKIKDFDKLRQEGCSEQTALSVIGASRATIYRWKHNYNKYGFHSLKPQSKARINKNRPCWTKELQGLIYSIRQKFPFWGKLKIQTVLKRDYFIEATIATVGRIISKLIKLGRILPVYLAIRKNKPKRKRKFNNHASRWKYGMKGKKPGELIQIDHMNVYKYSKRLRHFKAVCPVTKVMVLGTYTNATSLTARRFLEKVIEEMPFSVKSIQVDGGSEFMKHFEDYCNVKEIPLYVLPPKSPKYNGVVERCNRTAKSEFYSQYDGEFTVSEMMNDLQEYQGMYNNFRPPKFNSETQF